MRKYLLILSLLISAAGIAQAPNYLYGKDVIVTTRDTSSAEFTIRNTTRNVLGYFKNIGGGKGQYTLIPQTDIISLPDSLLARYTKAQSDARYKSISWSPTWSEVTDKPANFSTTYALSNDIQDSLLNKVTRSGSYADPSWITSLNYSKLVGTVPTWNQNTTGNSATVTNGVYTTGSYANPAWITSLDYSKLTGTVPTWNQNTTGNAATVTNGVYTTGSYADPSWIASLGWSKISGAPAFITGINSSMVTTALGYTPENISNKGVANGYADLDAGGKIPASRIDFGQTGQTFVVASQAAMLAVSGANIGALAVRTDESKNYRLIAQPASTLGNWQLLLSPDAPVQSVNGYTGNVNLLTTHISEGSNYWWTAARSRAAQSLTTTGNSGSATYDNSTGVLNVPTYTLAGLGGISLTSLSFTPGSGGYNSSTGVITIPTNTNQLTNGAGFITGYSETDPTIYAWAKAATKPSYSYSEITSTPTTWAWASITGIPSTFTPSAHSHGDADITDLAWGKITGVPALITGSGSTNFLPKFTGAGSIGNSSIFDNGSGVGIASGLTVGSTSYQNYAGIFVGGATTIGSTQWAIITDASMSGVDNRAFQANAKIAAGTAASTAYGVFIQNAEKLAGATITNNYGLYIQNPTSGSSLNYSIYSAGGLNYFAGATEFGAALSGTSFFMSGAGSFGGATVERTLNVSGDMLVSGTSAGVYFKGNTNNPFVWVEDNYALRFGTNNTERGRFTSGGNLLLKTTTESPNNEALQVAGSGLFTGNLKINTSGALIDQTSMVTSGGYYRLRNSGNDTYFGLDNSTGASVFSNTTAYSTYLITNDPRDLILGTNGLGRLFISSTGAIIASSSVTAASIIKSGSSDSYFLLGGGGHVLASTYATASSLSGYVDQSTNQYEIGGNKSFLGNVEVLSIKTTGGPGTPGVLKFGTKTNDTVFTGGSAYSIPVNIDGTTYYIRLWAGIN